MKKLLFSCALATLCNTVTTKLAADSYYYHYKLNPSTLLNYSGTKDISPSGISTIRSTDRSFSIDFLKNQKTATGVLRIAQFIQSNPRIEKIQLCFGVNPDYISATKLSPDNKWLAVGTAYGEVTIFMLDKNGNHKEISLPKNNFAIRDITFTMNSRCVLLNNRIRYDLPFDNDSDKEQKMIGNRTPNPLKTVYRLENQSPLYPSGISTIRSTDGSFSIDFLNDLNTGAGALRIFQNEKLNFTLVQILILSQKLH